MAAAQETLEELDRRYAPMGRGPLGAAEAARLAVAAALLLPLRVVAAVLLLVAYYLVYRVCTLGVEEERQGAEGPGDGYARLRGWRRDAVVRCGRNLARARLFVFGLALPHAVLAVDNTENPWTEVPARRAPRNPNTPRQEEYVPVPEEGSVEGVELVARHRLIAP